MRILVVAKFIVVWAFLVFLDVVMAAPAVDMQRPPSAPIVFAGLPLVSLKATSVSAKVARVIQQAKSTIRAERVAYTTARVAVQLAREDAGQYLTVKELAACAVELVTAALSARTALDGGQDPAPHYQAVKLVADRFNAAVVCRGDLHGMVVGLRLHSGRYASGFDDTFYVT